MQQYDPQKAARVWERVQSGPEPKPELRPDPGSELEELIRNQWTIGTTCLKLARQLGAREAAMLQGIFRESQAQAGCLKGMHILMTGQPAVTHAPQPEISAPEQTLRRCYGHMMRCLKAYEARQEDPEYGGVFAALAQQERDHCRRLLEMLGNLKKR